jgi:hypothetical protein
MRKLFGLGKQRALSGRANQTRLLDDTLCPPNFDDIIEESDIHRDGFIFLTG